MKKILGKFQNKDKYDETIDISSESIKETKYSTPPRYNDQKDVDAKVLYQYPKGQFRFPLIPDEQPRGRERSSRAHQVKDQAGDLEQRRKPKVIRQDSGKKPAPSKTSKETNIEIPKKKENNYSKRPFRPTEIPSPIFGYEQRPRKSDIVEYELDEFIKTPFEHGEDTLEIHNDSNLKQAVNPVTVQGGFETSSDEFVDSEYHQDKETSAQDLISSPSNEFSTKREIMEDKHFIQMENQGDLTEIHKEDIFTDSVVLEEHHLSDELDRQEDDFEETDLIEDISLQMEDEDLTIKEEAYVLYEEGELSIQEEVNVLYEEDTDKEKLLPEESIEVDSLETQSDNEVVLNNVNQEETAIQQNDETTSQAKRSHIPFNVLMLKQDKYKLEQKLKTRVEENNVQESINNPREQTNESVNQAWKEAAVSIQQEDDLEENETNEYYVFPSQDLLKPSVNQDMSTEWLDYQRQLLNETLLNFNVRANVVNVTQGPSVTRFEVQPEPGVKVNKITNLADDIKLSLAAKDIRIEAPIPGKHTIGIEVPNPQSRPVFISEIINSPEFQDQPSSLTAVLGLDISGKPIVTDLRKMPHGLIAGATGSGKSVCINTILVSLLYKANPNDVKLLLIDPKMVELAPYNQIPHLVSPVITDVKAATAALKWAVEEMERRYELFAHTGVRDITRFNELAESHKQYSDKLPYIVIIIDELADLMMMAPGDVEEAICRIAQKARACGIHLIIATQRPSVDVITGLIKANVPTRIAFSVSSQIDSRTIIDISGAEKLLGKGDMLFLENGSSKPVRLQGTFVSDEEIDAVVAHVKREQKPQYLFEQEELLKKAQVSEEEDELFLEACEFVVDQGGASTSSLQRRFKIGYNRAARLIDMMEDQGFISEARGSKPRDVLITESDLESIQDTSTIN
ncbi:DNA translocase FtsK [Cytobacillus sp. FJAT-54145]|uniref:DNA translocase FtsK n=1 Tax=Cytobacillus spartinae TaxID=3299023 RepID=A0ABW6KGJ9_9BACI